jgi:hypothetical protein
MDERQRIRQGSGFVVGRFLFASYGIEGLVELRHDLLALLKRDWIQLKMRMHNMHPIIVRDVTLINLCWGRAGMKGTNECFQWNMFPT